MLFLSTFCFHHSLCPMCQFFPLIPFPEKWISLLFLLGLVFEQSWGGNMCSGLYTQAIEESSLIWEMILVEYNEKWKQNDFYVVLVGYTVHLIRATVFNLVCSFLPQLPPNLRVWIFTNVFYSLALLSMNLSLVRYLQT